MSEWEGGDRQTFPWLRLAVASFVVVAIAVALLNWRPSDQLAIDADPTPSPHASEPADILGTEPLPRGSRECPPTHPVLAYDGEGAYYPKEYPRGTSPVSRPDRCFATPQQAADAGYRLGDPPDGTALAAGVYLEPTRAPSHTDCSALAAHVGYPVPCPRRLPTPSDGPRCEIPECTAPGPERPAALGRANNIGVVIQHRGFLVPQESPWLGIPRTLVVTAVPIAAQGRDGVVRVAGPSEFVSCFPERGVTPAGQDVYRNCLDARPWAEGQGGFPLEGATSAVWRRGDVVYAAGIAGAGDHIDVLLASVIENIEYVPPP